ncbi:hypothetical protein [Luteimicrobium xylanilyticum]|uniref:hypothetical protein n=1 Tax=Luteimicrobium xylanilyticum TaxID=1133546 RepID=UPI0011D1F5DC|nr:hypothetical protein [Luteimicrobium xylanilyticum]
MTSSAPRSLTRVQHVLRALPTGGGTPLASAFSLVTRLARDYERDAVDVVVLTDGRANVAENGGGVDRAAVRRDVRARPGSDDARRQAEQSLRRLLGVAHVRVETVGRPQHGAWLREVVTRSASGTR